MNDRRTHNAEAQETQPQIGDMLKRECGTLAIIEQVFEQGGVILGRVIQAPEWRGVKTGSIVRMPAELIGVSWAIIA